jgi:putative addiction module killer protein
VITIATYTIKRMPEFDIWLSGIKDGFTRIRLARRIDRLQRGLLGDVAPVGKAVHELRELFGPGWRIYFTQRKGMLIVLLGGGAKSTQKEDTARAVALSQTLSE